MLHWGRACRALRAAGRLLPQMPEDASSRAYYAAFHAISAVFALSGKTFAKHSAVETAVHRDLVQTGRLPVEIGKDYSALARLRLTGDYTVVEEVTIEMATEGASQALCILRAVQQMYPDIFTDPESLLKDNTKE